MSSSEMGGGHLKFRDMETTELITYNHKLVCDEKEVKVYIGFVLIKD